MAAGFAARRLDLDDIGPEIAEQLAAELAGFVREFEDPQTRKAAPESAGRRSPEHFLHVRESFPLCRPERAVVEAGAQLVMAIAEQAFDDLPRMLPDQRARQVIERGSFATA